MFPRLTYVADLLDPITSFSLLVFLPLDDYTQLLLPGSHFAVLSVSFVLSFIYASKYQQTPGERFFIALIIVSNIASDQPG